MSYSAYIHIPFCRNKCNYCSFVSYTGCDATTKREYVESLLNEINHFYKNEPLNTLYFGGGTPSLLDISDLYRIVGCFNLDGNAEITIEVNPETVDEYYLKELLNIGFNRISIGIQSFDDKILKNIGRIHKSDRAINTVKVAKSVGFNNISVDFIYGLPNQTKESFINDLKKAVELNVQHISLYGLKIEEGCKFFENYPVNIADDDEQADMYLDAIKILTANNFEHYEISNFCKQGFESKHNLNYWNCEEYYGFGVAAHGYIDGVRYSNHEELPKYLSDFKTKASEQRLSVAEMLEEHFFLGFRRGNGVNVEQINQKFNIDFESTYKNVLDKYIQSGHLIRTTDGYKFSDEGFLLSNIVLADFIYC